MSEQNNVNTTEEKTNKKPVAKANPKTEEKEKVGVFKRIGNWIKTNKKALIAGGGGILVGAGTTLGVGYALNKRAERKQRDAYIPQEQQSTYVENDSLDPNI